MHTISRLGSSTALRGSPLTTVSQLSAHPRSHNASALHVLATSHTVRPSADRTAGQAGPQSGIGRTLSVLAASTLAAGIWLGSPMVNEAHAESITDKISSLTSSSKGSSSASIALDKLPPLPFAPDALEPYIDTTTMQIHHDKHHQAYVTKLQTALSQAPTLKGKSLEELNKAVGTREVPSDVTTAVRNNGGGHWNHSFFWQVLAPAQSKEADYQASASDELKKGIEEVWGSLNAFQAKFNESAAAVFGSGWAWLGVDGSGKLVISTTSNQDNPLMQNMVKQAHTPVLGLDVWEHAYYLKYQNKRPDYLNSWWHVVNWSQVSKNLELAKAGQPPATQ